VWQMDMRHGHTDVDGVVRDMADINFDVKLRAIVTCARVVEFASSQYAGRVFSTKSQFATTEAEKKV